MKIKGAEFLFLVQVLKDSLTVKNGYDWQFKHKFEERNRFYKKLISYIIEHTNLEIDIKSLFDD